MALRGAACFVVFMWTALFAFAAPAMAQDGDQLFAKAEQALNAGNATEAADLYSQAIRSGRLAKEKLAQAFLQRGRAQQMAGQHARAVADFTNSLWLEALAAPDQARAYGWRATSRQALGQNNLASEDLAKARGLDPQFTAGAAPAASAPSSAPATPVLTGGESVGAPEVEVASAPAAPEGGGSSSGFLDRLFETSPSAGRAPTPPTRIVSGTRGSAPAAAAAAPAPVSAPAPAPEPASGGGGSTFLSRLFGTDDSSTATASADTGVTVREVEPLPQPSSAAASPAAAPAAAPAPAAGGGDFLTRLLATPENAERTTTAAATVPVATAGGIPVPRPKPAGAPAGGAAPVQLASLGQAAPAAAPAPSAAPESVSVSDTRVASVPPWTLGADNASSREESGSLPAIPSAGLGLTPSVSTRREDTRGRGLPTASSGWVSGSGSRAAPAPAAAAPVLLAAADPAEAPAPAPTPIVPAASAAAAAPAPAAPSRAPNVAELDWGSATEVSRAAPPAAPAPVVAPVPASAPAPVARAAAPAAPIPAPVTTVRRAAPAPAAPAPAPQPRYAAAPAYAQGYPAAQGGYPQGYPPRPYAGGWGSRIFQVAGQAFSGRPWGAPAPAPQQVAAVAPPPPAPATAPAAPQPAPARAAAPVVAPAARSGGGSGYAVQVAAARSEQEAQATAASVAGRYADLFGGAAPNVVRADIPGKGTYYRVRFGPYGGQQAASICQQLKGRGTDCFTVAP